MNETALESSLAYHGRKLAESLREKAFEEKDEILINSLKNVEYKAAQRRRTPTTVTLNDDETSNSLDKRLKDFILKKQKLVFSSLEPVKTAEADLFSNPLAVGATPSLENFVSMNKRDEEEKFFSDIRVGDAVCVEVRSVENYAVTVRVLCTDGVFERDVSDLHIEIFVAREEFVKNDIPWRDINKRSFLRATVLSVDANRREISLTFVPSSKLPSVRLGIITENELPPYFRSGESRHHAKYDECLRTSAGFRNPSASELLCRRYRIPFYDSISFLDTLNNADYSPDGFARNLRKVQTHKLSMKSVAKGVERLRQNETTVAMQHFNKALEIEPDNAEALVGRGALYANKECYLLAIKDFDDALRLDANHANARKYLIETLFAQCKIYEQKKKRKRTLLFAQRILELDSTHDDARRILDKLEQLVNNNGDHLKLSEEEDSDSDVVEVGNSSTVGEASSTGKRRKSSTKANNSDEDFRRQLRSLYKSYGVDEKKFINDPELLAKLKTYHEKYTKSMKLGKNHGKQRVSSPANSVAGLSSYESSSSSEDEDNKKKRRKRANDKTMYVQEASKLRESPKSSSRKDVYVERQISREGKAVNRSFPSAERRDSRVPNGIGNAVSASAQKPKIDTKLKVDLRNMESFISALKTKKN